jgi:hypothetical protein
VRNLGQGQAALLPELTRRSPVQLGQDPFTRQHANGQHPLALGRRHRQSQPGRPERDRRVDVRVLTGQADHRWDQVDQPGPAGLGGVVVDVAGDRGQQGMGAGRVVAPALAGEQGGELHEAGALARAAVLATGQGREQRRELVVIARHGPSKQTRA